MESKSQPRFNSLDCRLSQNLKGEELDIFNQMWCQKCFQPAQNPKKCSTCSDEDTLYCTACLEIMSENHQQCQVCQQYIQGQDADKNLKMLLPRFSFSKCIYYMYGCQEENANLTHIRECKHQDQSRLNICKGCECHFIPEGSGRSTQCNVCPSLIEQENQDNSNQKGQDKKEEEEIKEQSHQIINLNQEMQQFQCPSIKDSDFNVLFVGNVAVGKSTLQSVYLGNFHDRIEPTINLEILSRYVPINGQLKKVCFWNISGNLKMIQFLRNYFQQKDLVFFVYSITDVDSFLDLESKWLKEIQNFAMPQIPRRFLIGNKSDQEDERMVTYDMGVKFSHDNNMQFKEVSATCGQFEFVQTLNTYFNDHFNELQIIPEESFEESKLIPITDVTGNNNADESHQPSNQDPDLLNQGMNQEVLDALDVRASAANNRHEEEQYHGNIPAADQVAPNNYPQQQQQSARQSIVSNRTSRQITRQNAFQKLFSKCRSCTRTNDQVQPKPRQKSQHLAKRFSKSETQTDNFYQMVLEATQASNNQPLSGTIAIDVSYKTSNFQTPEPSRKSKKTNQKKQ